MPPQHWPRFRIALLSSFGQVQKQFFGAGTRSRDFGRKPARATKVSNAIFAVMYSLDHGVGISGGLLGLLSGCWILNLSFGRLYLGVHSPMDVKGGMILGMVVALLAHNLANAFDGFMLRMPHAAFFLAAFASAVLVLRLARVRQDYLCRLTLGRTYKFTAIANRAALVPPARLAHRGTRSRVQ